MPYADRQQQLQYWNDYTKAHRKQNTKSSLNNYYQNRETVFNHYGRICCCCGAIEDLTTDHIIATIPRKNQPAMNYRQIIKAGFPSTIQILCRRCNRSKANTPACRLSHDEGAFRIS